MGFFYNRGVSYLYLFGLVVLSFTNHDCAAQIKFFINPNFNFKTSIAFVDPTSLNNNEKNIFENQFFYTPYAVSHSARVIKHQSNNIGIGIGLSYKNDSRIIQFSWNDDVARFRTSSYFRPYNYATHSGYTVSYYGKNLSRFALSYLHKISRKESVMQSWFSVGIGSFVNVDRYTDILPQYWDMVLAPNGDRLITTYLQPFEEKRVNGLVKLGFENDFFLKKKYLFSLNAYYIQGFGIISRVEYVHEYLINNEQVFSRTGLMSRGSGFYFEISRRFKVYNWDRKKN